jgi:ABC-2 type transport system ATP-binding protein
MSIEKGDIYGLVGQNGAGKTTLIRLITGLAFASGGELELLGATDAAGLETARTHIGSIVETPAFYPNLTAEQNLEYYRLQRGIPEKGCVRGALTLVGLADTGKKKFRNFSLGMKQRLGLALATLNNPDFIILDEPINGLDPTGIIEVREILRSLNEQGITILVSSHILSELSQIATRYGFIHQGNLVRQISNAELQEASKRALHVTVDDTAAAAAVLETVLEVKDYKVVSQHELRVYSYLDRPAELGQLFYRNGIAISSLSEVGDTLEDYYTNLIGGRN